MEYAFNPFRKIHNVYTSANKTFPRLKNSSVLCIMLSYKSNALPMINYSLYHVWGAELLTSTPCGEEQLV